jgi:exopolysaccharide biosynthesis protein
LRPRTFIGWRTTSKLSNASQTDAFIMTVQGRWNRGARWGGATVHQATEFLRQLGAGRAVGFDSGGSTTMLAQLKPGAGLTHIDRANPRDGQRAVINALTIVPLTAN